MAEAVRASRVDPRRVATACGLAVALLGLVVLGAWLAGNEPVKQLHPDWPTMKANTALGFVALGLSLALLVKGRTRAGQAVATVALLVGTLTLAQYVLGVDLGIDELLFEDTGSAAGTTGPGRPAVPTAAAFVLVSLALLAWPVPTRAAHVATSIAGFVALFNLAFYILDAIPPIEGTRMAVHTALAFLAMFAGIALVRSRALAELFLGRDRASSVARILVLPVIGLPLLNGQLAKRLVASGLMEVEQARAVALFLNLVALATLVTFVLLRLQREERRAERVRSDLALTVRRTDDAERVTGRGSWQWDIASNQAVWSHGMYRLFGVDPATFVNSNDNFLALVHPDDRQRMLKALTDALAKPSRFYQEYRVQRPDGQLVHVRGEGNVVADAAGAPAMMYGVVADVTALKELEEARRQAEKAVQDSEARLRAVLDNASDAILTGDARATIVGWNPAAERIFGYTAGEAIGRSIGELLPAAHWAEYQADIAQSQQGQPSRHLGRAREMQAIRKDGARVEIELSLSAWTGPAGPMVTAVVRDVTDRKQAQAAIERAQRRFATVFQLSPVAIALTREDGSFVDANEAFAQLSGYARESLLDGTFSAVRLWEDPAERTRLIANLRQHGLVRDLELRLRRQDGAVRTTLANVEFVDLGGATTILTLLQDITERKRQEDERAARIESEAELERLRRNDRFRTDFINNIAHELATPLTPLVLKSRTLAADPSLTPQQRAHLDGIERSLARLRHLIEDMVGAADLQSRTLAIDRRRLNLTRELRAAVAAQQPSAERAGVAIEGPEDSGLSVSADPTRLQLVLGHLLGNAVKFTPPGGRVRVSSRRDGEMVRVELQDTGVGLTRAQMEGLWKPFAQAHDKSQRTDSGSGLGLYVTKGIVELHGGQAGCSSPGPGQGSTFWFTLPLATGHVDPLARKGEAAPDGPRRNLNPSVPDDGA